MTRVSGESVRRGLFSLLEQGNQFHNSKSKIERRRGWRSGKISAFQPQGPEFDLLLSRVLNICETFFSAKVDSAFHPPEVVK